MADTSPRQEKRQGEDMLNIITSRRSIRKYLQVPVEWDKIGMILEAGRYAPSAGNLQNWRCIVVTEQVKRQKIAEACLQQYWMTKAPVQIVIVATTEKAKMFYGIRGERLYSVQNCAAVAINMMLQAEACGLATCWVGAFDEEMMKTAVDCSGDARPQLVLTLGYADERVPVPKRDALEDVADIETFGNKIKDLDAVMNWYGNKLQRRAQQAKSFLDKAATATEKGSKGYLRKLKGRFRLP